MRAFTRKIPYEELLRNKHVLFAGVFAVCFIIGLCTLLAGCNPDLDNQCIAYNLVEGTVYDYKFTSQTCRKCRHNHVSCYDYPCYSAFVKIHYGNNQTCLMETRKDSSSENAAHLSVDSYDIGEKLHVIKMKMDNTCSEPSTGLVTWGAGVAFLTLCGVVLIAWVAYFVLFEYKQGQYFSMKEEEAEPGGESNYHNVSHPASNTNGTESTDSKNAKSVVPSAPAYSPLHDNL